MNGPGERTVWKSTGQVPDTLRRWDRHRVERARREDHVEEPGRMCPGDSVAESAQVVAVQVDPEE